MRESGVVTDVCVREKEREREREREREPRVRLPRLLRGGSLGGRDDTAGDQVSRRCRVEVAVEIFTLPCSPLTVICS